MSRWDGRLFLLVMAVSGAGVLGALALDRVTSPWGAAASLVVLWAGMAGAVLVALLRARPSGLFEFRMIDIVWGIGLGLVLRGLSGALTSLGDPSFPSIPTVDGTIPTSWWWSEAAPAVVIAPLLEEMFFRAVILVVVYQIFRASVGPVSAAVTALLASSGTFVLLHATFAMVSFEQSLELLAVGGVCSGLVLLTGRVWAAVVAHVTYNVLFLVLALAGTVLASGSA